MVSAEKGEGRAAAGIHLATNEYPWSVFYQRDGRDFASSLEAVLGEVAASGIQGYEPLAVSPAQVDSMAPLLRKHGLEMRSLYVNSFLHEADQVEKSVSQVLAIAGRAVEIGTRIIVTNPSPLRWGGTENKTDDQLRVQAHSLENLGKRLRTMGLKLAYHNHHIELRAAAREFHHMMAGTDPECVTLCLDAHWIYRGSGNSSVALFDILKLYGRRVSELHIRQSRNHIWTEVFGDGDIDYPALVQYLVSLGVKPHLVLEQAVEKESPKTLDALEAHRRSCESARRIFAPFSG
ncbi:MAG: TIM barrel protein [Acidobacteria bacterium]|nr:TIM barrel protein [Acidobacteriota bacterium]